MAGYFIGFTISINSYFVVMQKQGNWSVIEACKKLCNRPVKEFIDMPSRLA
jgi:hypothetical protein